MADDHSDQDRKWTIRATAVVIGFLAFSIFVAIVGLPVLQAPNAGIDAWTAICRAVGLKPGTPAQPQPSSSSVAAPVSQVRWSARTLKVLAAADPRPGAQLAGAVCVNCHGEGGISTSADYPHLAGQSAEAIYKQLSDYRTGARAHPQMSPVAQQLMEPQLAQVAAYFAGHGDVAALGRREEYDDPAIARIAHRGDPKRGIPPCESCHARNSGGPIEAPVLVGQQQDYLYRQLKAYASGDRRNDVYRRMREIAARLSDDEMKRFGEYYQGFR